MMEFPFVTDDKPKEQLQRSLPKGTETGCNDECAHGSEAAETWSSPPEMGSVSAFFSLAALAEVAAMENVHRSVVESLVPPGLWGPVQRPPFRTAWMGKQLLAFLTPCVILLTMHWGSRAPLLM